jgi:integrase
MWRADRWAPACRAVGLDPVPTPYDLRHSYSPLLLAEGKQPIWIAKQLGHSLAVFPSTYARLIDEHADRERTASGSTPTPRSRRRGAKSVRIWYAPRLDERAIGDCSHDKPLQTRLYR